MARSPYSDLPQRAFWRGGVAGPGPFDLPDLYRPRFALTPETRVFTAGSCFAQHVGGALKRAGLSVIDTEPALRGMPPETAKRFGYGVYAARFGNIYTVRQFRQLIEEMLGLFSPALPIWERDGRFWDALRPGIEPEGLTSAEQVVEMRTQHLIALARAVQEAEVMVFTLGLTEAWEHRETGTVYPTAPGTIAGDYDPDLFVFRNHGVAEILEDFTALERMLTEINPGLQWILTVSPVPLAATASGDHVLAATMRSKSVLRVVCDLLYESSAAIDYFPSYELVMSPAHPAGAFASDLRSVRPEVVDGIMELFLKAHGLTAEPIPSAPTDGDGEGGDGDGALCEDVLLDAFRP
ncbi:GSCFA domain-containing protein [Roseicyclus marinus]|uniref:GSCFA domain-containing protein n=1 Tax=Roseicyclus marinus TaxID=2161673 RepID=UPI00240FE858|nr:GSCFA domain-containing protein [Roseicyclus marinus]MDG3042059.1 GSCFA domain-containing protein [Roseicyclus marinus]